MELSQIVKASMEYARYKDSILNNHIVDIDSNKFITYGDEAELADKIIRMINAVDKMIENL